MFVGPKGKGKAKAAARANTAEVVDASPAAESAFTETPTPLVSVVVEKGVSVLKTTLEVWKAN